MLGGSNKSDCPWSRPPDMVSDTLPGDSNALRSAYRASKIEPMIKMATPSHMNGSILIIRDSRVYISDHGTCGAPVYF